MKKSKVVLSAFFIISLFIQIMYFNNSDVFYQYGFAIGIDSSVKQLDIAINLIYVLLPITFIIFLLSGSVERLKSGYGKLLIIRNYSKTKLYLKNFIKNNIIILIIVFFQTVLYSSVHTMFKSSNGNIFKSIVIYYVVLSLIITIQCILELITMPHIANIIIFIYCYVSCFVAQITPNNIFVKILMFPCLLFGMQNGAIQGNDLYFVFLSVSIFLNTIITLLAILKFKKTDIF